MMDEERRDIERQAQAGDEEAALRLQHARCRHGECCAHALTAPLSLLLPSLPPALAGSARVAVELDTIELDGSVASGRLTVTAPNYSSLRAALDWLQRMFPTGYDPITGHLARTRTLGELNLVAPPDSPRCPWCHGRGRVTVANGDSDDCPACLGLGVVAHCQVPGDCPDCQVPGGES